MKNECVLCGGKLRNGVCTECGMDNSKSDRMYQNALNRGECKGENLTHIHEENKVKKYQQPTINKNREKEKQPDWNKKAEQGKANTAQGSYKGYRYTSSNSLNNSKPLNKGKQGKNTGLIVSVVVCVLLFVIGITLMAIGSQTTAEPDFSEEDFYAPEFDGYYRDGALAERALEPDGDVWEQALEPGTYLVGADIPEGMYEMHGEEGNQLEVTDNENGVYIAERFGTGEGDISGIEEVPLFTGAIVLVDGKSPVNFKTENGQVESMTEKMENPLTETVEISDTAVAGADFPAGTYDVVADGEGFGTVTYAIAHDSEQDYTRSFYILMEKTPSASNPEYCSVYKNVVFPEGSVINADEFPVKLVPSEKIVSEDYFSFYDKIF